MREHAEPQSEQVQESPPLPSAPALGLLPSPSSRAASARRLVPRASPADGEVLARGTQALARAVQGRHGVRVRQIARIFERADAKADPAGAKAALAEFAKLAPADRTKELAARYPAGDVTATLDALGRTPGFDPALDGTIREILRWIEKTEVLASTGKSEADLVKLQADKLKAEAKAKKKPPRDWGGAKTKAATRFAALSDPEKAAWKTRGQAAIKTMAAWCGANKPELKVQESSFELDFEGVDMVSLGAIATGGSKTGETVAVGFEFIVAVEMDPQYALSTVVHELYGHPTYDPGSSINYEQSLYKKAVASLPWGTVSDRQGTETYGYWPSEIYSLLKEIPYWTEVSASDKAKSVALPGGKSTTMDLINYDPRGAIEDWLKALQARWDPTVAEGLLRGYYKWLRNDPTIWGQSYYEFSRLVKKVFGDPVAAKMTA